ncbi:hypothetical protein L0U88_12210 [Flavihumibacter sp. RY-1]|uniref:Uncharacterized protein n=1 Tax=Flavihumibacter fluminis TaxID=2909236 RepID=A0ABS9BL78_9BACT|nr:hypothetical protein [Flavihumibacter fluminis]MCF1715391.1 hypothetical protein [Flavihumibacter fluminis]
MEIPEQDYIKGFNIGYQLNKLDPQLLAQLLKSKSENSQYLQAMQMGAKQHDRELLLEQLKRNQDRDKERGRGRSR